MGNGRSRESSIDSDEGLFEGSGDDNGQLREYTARDKPALEEENFEVCSRYR